MIYECAWFNQRVQLAEESVEQFNTNLYQLVEHCEHGKLKEEMIHDRIVVSIRDSTLSEKPLQLDSELTLKRAKKSGKKRQFMNTNSF